MRDGGTHASAALGIDLSRTHRQAPRCGRAFLAPRFCCPFIFQPCPPLDGSSSLNHYEDSTSWLAHDRFFPESWSERDSWALSVFSGTDLCLLDHIAGLLMACKSNRARTPEKCRRHAGCRKHELCSISHTPARALRNGFGRVVLVCIVAGIVANILADLADAMVLATSDAR